MTLLAIETKHTALAACCAPHLWMHQQLKDNNINYKEVPLKCGKVSIVNITKNSRP